MHASLLERVRRRDDRDKRPPARTIEPAPPARTVDSDSDRDSDFRVRPSRRAGRRPGRTGFDRRGGERRGGNAPRADDARSTTPARVPIRTRSPIPIPIRIRSRRGFRARPVPARRPGSAFRDARPAVPAGVAPPTASGGGFACNYRIGRGGGWNKTRRNGRAPRFRRGGVPFRPFRKPRERGPNRRRRDVASRPRQSRSRSRSRTGGRGRVVAESSPGTIAGKTARAGVASRVSGGPEPRSGTGARGPRRSLASPPSGDAPARPCGTARGAPRRTGGRPASWPARPSCRSRPG